MRRRAQHANVSQVTSQLWIGGDLEVRSPSLAGVQLNELDDLGITDVVDVRLEWNDQGWVSEAKPHMNHHWLGVDDAGRAMPDEWFDQGTDLIRSALSAGGSVLVHCHMGINRLFRVPVGVSGARVWAWLRGEGRRGPQDRERPSCPTEGPRRCPSLRRLPLRAAITTRPTALAATCSSVWVGCTC